MIKNLFLKNGSKAKLLWMLMLGCVLGFSLTSCASKDEGEDSETYETRQYIIGIGKWNTQEVKLPDGTWTSDSRTYGKDFVLEFFDKKSGESDRRFKSWEYIPKSTGSYEADEVLYEGVYVVNKKTITCTVNGKKYLQFLVTSMADRGLVGNVTFFNDNKSFDVRMQRTW